jgi:hypothetical protein
VRVALFAVVAVVAACTGAESVTPEPLGDYTTWDTIETYGPAPGHGDTYRIIYINDIARRMGTATVGATLVKEVRDNDGGAPGELRVIEIMRKVRGGIAVEDEGGWLFTATDAPGGAETHTDTCWNRCHVAAPNNGVWFDYTK